MCVRAYMVYACLVGRRASGERKSVGHIEGEGGKRYRPFPPIAAVRPWIFSEKSSMHASGARDLGFP